MMKWKQLDSMVLLTLFAFGCGDAEPEVSEALRPVRYIEARQAGTTSSRILAGVVRSGVESRLSFRVPGIILSLNIEVGSVVEKGQEIARLDPTDYALRVEEAKAALAQARAGLRRAQADYDRVRSLYENSNAAKAELDSARASSESAKAQVDAVTKQLELAIQQVGYTTLAVPEDGAIASIDVEVNENVDAGKQICLLVSGSQPEAAIPVPEGLIAQMYKGQEVAITLDALPGRTYLAQVKEVGVAVTGAATTYLVTARFLEADIDIRAGMAAEVTFLFDVPESDHILVPLVAVGEDRDGRFVFVIEESSESKGIVHRRAVEMTSTARGIEIIDGLDEGELVVTAGVRRLVDGETVKLLGPEGAAE
jgi:RND family efflux transporter MFP subunit